jgi:hypothetical protein
VFDSQLIHKVGHSPPVYDPNLYFNVKAVTCVFCWRRVQRLVLGPPFSSAVGFCSRAGGHEVLTKSSALFLMLILVLLGHAVEDCSFSVWMSTLVSCFSALSCAFNWVDWLTVSDKQGLEKRLCHASYNKFQLWLSIGSGVVVCSDKLLCIVYRTRKMNKRTDVPAVWLINEYTCLIGESDVL